MSGDEPDYELTSAFRYDPEALCPAQWNTFRNGHQESPYLLLSYTVDRLTEAARIHSWTTPPELTLHSLKSLCDTALNEKNRSLPHKIRVSLSKQGVISIGAVPIQMSNQQGGDLFSVPTLNSTTRPSSGFEISLFCDTEPTLTSKFTETKTTRREAYNLARLRVGIPAVGDEPGTPKDVILYGIEDQVMETSIRNIAFWRGGRWVTPPLLDGCLPGIARRFLLEEGKIVEGRVLMKDLKVGEVLLVFNAVEGARLGKITDRSVV